MLWVPQNIPQIAADESTFVTRQSPSHITCYLVVKLFDYLAWLQLNFVDFAVVVIRGLFEGISFFGSIDRNCKSAKFAEQCSESQTQ